MRLVNRVLEARKQAGLSQAALAEASDVAIATIAKVEANNGYAPSGTTMLKLAKTLGCDVSALFWSAAPEPAEAVAS